MSQVKSRASAGAIRTDIQSHPRLVPVVPGGSPSNERGSSRGRVAGERPRPGLETKQLRSLLPLPLPVPLPPPP
eukprot:8220913-Pyramimonas_sp.AAC.1